MISGLSYGRLREFYCLFFEKDSLPWHVVGLLVVVHVSTLVVIGAALDISEK